MDAMKQAAHTASVMTDGDEAQRIIVDRAIEHIKNPDPDSPFMASDYFDVDLDNFLRMKKTMQRLTLLLDFPCSSSLWITIKGLEDHVTLAVQNGGLHRYWTFGQLKFKPENREMIECLSTGSVTAAPLEESEAMITVLAPVKNSLYDTVGCIEFSAPLP